MMWSRVRFAEGERAFFVAAPIVALFVFQLADTFWLKLQYWDESRLAVNAIEMLRTGDRFVTSYGFAPDLWNTKPPLVVNLMALSMQVFGGTVFALRLPSALSACACVLLVAWFVRRATGSLATGVAAGILLAGSSLFYGHHGGQTGDYDAPLTLLTTGYALLLFTLVGAERPSLARAAGAGVLVGLAVLTKGVAGLVPGVGIAVYALAFGPRKSWAHWRAYLIVGAVGLTVGASYYMARSGDAAYLSAVMANDLGGRFGQALDRHVGGPEFYVIALLWRSTALLFPLVGGLWLLPRGRSRRLGLFALCHVTGMLIVYSVAATKLRWYILPALPFLCIAMAIGGAALAGRVREGRSVALVLLVAVAAQAVAFRYARGIDPAAAPAFDELIAAAATTHRGTALTVVEPGVNNRAGFTAYAPTLRFYALASRQRVRQAASVSDAGGATLIGTCEPKIALPGRIVWRSGRCTLHEQVGSDQAAPTASFLPE